MTYPKMIIELRLNGQHAGYVQCKSRMTRDRHYALTKNEAEAYEFFNPMWFIKISCRDYFSPMTLHLIDTSTRLEIEI